MKINWKYILLFIFLSLGLSFTFRLGFWDVLFQSFAPSTFLSESSYLVAGSSTLVAGGIALFLHNGLSKEITLWGDEKVKNLLLLSLPLLAFSIVGLPNKVGLHNSVYGFSFAMVNTVYALAEEFGWRRYLQNALEGLNKNIKYLFIAVIWWIWHFRFETQFDVFIFPLICLGAGFFIRKISG